MKNVLALLLGFGMVFGMLASVQAADKKEEKKADAKEVTLKGSITCAKCDLKLTDKCATVIKVKDGDKDVVYYFDAKGDKAHHEAICKAAKAGSVTGTVSEKEGKKIITVSKVAFDK